MVPCSGGGFQCGACGDARNTDVRRRIGSPASPRDILLTQAVCRIEPDVACRVRPERGSSVGDLPPDPALLLSSLLRCVAPLDALRLL